MTTTLPPLITRRKLVEPLWGGTRLAAWLELPEPRPARLGESWQVFDSNPVANGPFAGRTLAELARDYGPALVGARAIARYGADVPLLAKFIDAADCLSIQVHPDDAYAHRVEAHTGFHGKTEAWYILDAAPGATVTYGLKRPCTRAEFAAAVAAGTVEALMARLPVAPGDVIFVPAGTLHAINAGIMLFEIQQKSDLTYRVYDYGRRDPRTGQPRELHLEKALEVSGFAPAPRGVIRPLTLATDRDLLVACPSFALERWRVAERAALAVDPASFEILTVIDGAGGIEPEDPRHAPLALRRGDSAVLPASLGACALRGPMTVLRASIPDLGELAAAARAAGNPEERIGEVIHPE